MNPSHNLREQKRDLSPYLFHFTKGPDCKERLESILSEECLKSELGYDEVFRLIMESDIIIDYYTDPNAGLSLRPMEAMFLEKKLITNNITIRNYDFYSDSNIFICQNSFDGIQSFISKEYQTVKKEIKDQYLLSSWKASFDR